MMHESILTNRIETTRGALNRGAITLPETVTWLSYPDPFNVRRWFRVGEFPHAAMAPPEDMCRARLMIVINAGHVDEMTSDPECTREHGHADELHVAHLEPGLPIAAWRNA
jgi:hypothetical protein